MVNICPVLYCVYTCQPFRRQHVWASSQHSPFDQTPPLPLLGLCLCTKRSKEKVGEWKQIVRKGGGWVSTTEVQGRDLLEGPCWILGDAGSCTCS